MSLIRPDRCPDDTIIDLWGANPNRPPVDTHHPAVRTHPVTGLKALNVNPGFVTGFAELKKKESGNYAIRVSMFTVDMSADIASTQISFLTSSTITFTPPMTIS